MWMIVILEFNDLSDEQADLIDNIEIEKAIKEKYASSLARKSRIWMPIYWYSYRKRILRFDEAEYQLTVKKLVLSDVLKLWWGFLFEVTSQANEFGGVNCNLMLMFIMSVFMV